MTETLPTLFPLVWLNAAPSRFDFDRWIILMLSNRRAARRDYYAARRTLSTG